MPKPHISFPRPSQSEIGAITAPSTEAVRLPIRKPLADWLAAQTNVATSLSAGELASEAIAAHLRQLSKLHTIGDGMSESELSELNRTTAQRRWERWRKETGREKGSVVRSGNSVRMAVTDAAYVRFVLLSDNARERVRLCGEAISRGLREVSASAVESYCKSHKDAAKSFITAPRADADSAGEIARNLGLPASKVVSFALENADQATT